MDAYTRPQSLNDKETTVGKGDRRNSNKMLKRRSRARFKARNNRPKQLARPPVVAKPKKAAEADSEEDSE